MNLLLLLLLLPSKVLPSKELLPSKEDQESLPSKVLPSKEDQEKEQEQC